MRKKLEFLFVIDVSGSMYGKKIAAVNAAFTECLAELKQISYSVNCDIKVSIMSFAEKFQFHKISEDLDKIEALHLKIEHGKDGFYPITLYECIYNGLQYWFEQKNIENSNQEQNTYIILFSDAKPVDTKEYENIYEKIQQYTEYRNAVKYVAYAEEGNDKYNEDTVKFVDFKAEHILPIADISVEINKLQMTFMTDDSDRSDNEKYEQIFV